MKFSNRWLAAAVFVAVSFGAQACSFVSSAIPTTTDSVGEAWYTRDRYLLFIYLGTDIYFCPSESDTCYKADIEG